MIQWGTVGEWVGGVGAIIGAGVPLVLYLIERRERIAAQAEAKMLRAHELKRARQEQARRVSVSFTSALQKVANRQVVRHFPVLRNDSDLPVRRAALVSRIHEAERIVASWGVAGPGEHVGKPVRNSVLSMPHRLVFVDDDGIWWARHSTGGLEEIDASALDNVPTATPDDFEE